MKLRYALLQPIKDALNWIHATIGGITHEHVVMSIIAIFIVAPSIIALGVGLYFLVQSQVLIFFVSLVFSFIWMVYSMSVIGYAIDS
jgi:hypothetical protein